MTSLLAGHVLLVVLGFQDPGTLAATHLDESRQTAWQLAMIVVEKLLPEGKAADDFPGLKAFVADVKKAGQGIDAEKPARDWAPFDVNVLVTHNPNFWKANYEVAPGDPAWISLHAALLLAGGEAARSQYVLEMARLNPGTPKEIFTVIALIESHSARVLKEFQAEVTRGTKKFDAGQIDEAMAIYRGTLKTWPQNGWALYEIGYTLMSKELERLRNKPGQADAEINPHTPEVVAKFAESRAHDPFQANAYQGAANEAVPRIQAVATASPIFQKIAKVSEKKPISDAELKTFVESCETAQIDEVALVARQIMVLRRGRFAPEDHPHITECLRRLAPGEVTERTLKRLAGERVVLRQITVLDKMPKGNR